MSWFKGLFKSKDEKFEEEYPFLILSPRVPMEEELGISKEEVLLNYISKWMFSRGCLQ